MNKRTKSLLYTWVAVGFFSALSCSDSTELGLSLVEQEQSDIIFTDTSTLIMTTQEAQPVVTSGRSIMTCGSYDDPIWGAARASTYMNFQLRTTGSSFPNSTLDSIVLLLAYEPLGQYGEIRTNKPSNVAQVWEVARLVEDLNDGTSYRSDASFATDDVNLLADNVVFNPNDTVRIDVDGQDQDPHLRILLDAPAGIALGNDLLNPQGAAANIYDGNNEFKAWFKGIEIRPAASNPSDASILRFKAEDDLTQLSVYYTDNSTGTPEKKRVDFLTNEDAETVTAFTHTHPAPLTDNLPSDTLVYVQGLDGLHTKIEMPYLTNLGNVIINKAELVVYVAGTGSLDFPDPNQIVAKFLDESGDLIVIDDIITSLNTSRSYLLFQGALAANPQGQRFYTMAITEHLQRMVEGKTRESAIYITLPSALDAERLSLINEKGQFGAKLYLTYTRY